MGHRPDNPAGDALATVRASQAAVTTKRAFEFLVLTAARSGEVRLATWDEMDLDAGVWTIPAARMKAKRDHRVPLSGRALAILHDVQRLSDGPGVVFPKPRGKPRSDATLSQLIKELGIAAVPHGFRSSFRDWAAEQTNTPREVVEAALAHTVRNPTEAAYARSDLFERRRRLMDEWAAYLSGTHGARPPQVHAAVHNSGINRYFCVSNPISSRTMNRMNPPHRLGCQSSRWKPGSYLPLPKHHGTGAGGGALGRALTELW